MLANIVLILLHPPTLRLQLLTILTKTKPLDKEKRNSVAVLPRHHPWQGCVYICELAGQAEALHPQPAPRVAPGPGQRESGAARVRSDQSSRDRGPSHIQSVTSVTQ